MHSLMPFSPTEPLTGSSGQAIAMIVYFVIMIMIGVWAYTRTNNVDDYMLGGRELNPLVAALSAAAADMSGWLMMGLPGALYMTGIVEGWIAVGLTLGSWLNWMITAPRLRSYTEVSNNSITIPSFFSSRVRDSSNMIRVIAGTIIFIFFTIYVASGMVSGGKFFKSSFGVDYHVGMTIIAAIVVLYTLVGGFLAVSWTDMVQGMMMVIALVSVPILGLIAIGGFGELGADLYAKNPDMLNPIGGTGAVAIISNLAWGLGYFGMPHIIVRFMALKSSRQAKTARRIGLGWMLFSVFGAAFTALIGVSMQAKGQINVEDQETVFLLMGQALFPALIAGFILAAILAAIMSTVSSQLLVVSSAVVEDIYNSFSKHDVKKAKWSINFNQSVVKENYLGITLGRIVVFVIAILGATIAWFGDDPKSFANSILGLVSFAWAGFGASFGPIVILALYWRKLTAAGTMTGMVLGAATTVVWKYFFNSGEKSLIVDTGLYEILPGFVMCILGAWLVSTLTYKPNPEIEEEFDNAVRLAKAKTAAEEAEIRASIPALAAADKEAAEALAKAKAEAQA